MIELLDTSKIPFPANAAIEIPGIFRSRRRIFGSFRGALLTRSSCRPDPHWPMRLGIGMLRQAERIVSVHFFQTISRLFLFGVILISTPSRADTLVEVGRELPRMEVLVCPTLDTAKVQANKSWDLGKREFDRNTFVAEILAPRCHGAAIWVTPRYQEHSIRPFVTWVDVLDATSSDSAELQTSDGAVRVRTSAGRQEVRWYYADIRFPDGKIYQGWVEIPDRPYGAVYIRSSLVEQSRLRWRQ